MESYLKSNYTFITEQNKFNLNKPLNQNMVYYSELNEWYTENSFRSFSVKYILEGSIHYETNDQYFDVKPGQLLIARQQPNVKAMFESKPGVRSICIDITSNQIADVFRVLSNNGENLLDDERFMNSNYWDLPEKLSSLESLKNISCMDSLVYTIQKSKETVPIHRDWFYTLTEQLLHSLVQNRLSKNALSPTKISTRNEWLKRLSSAIDYMDENFLSIQSIAEIAHFALLSEYHFIRLFKKRFNMTPYQYILNKRVECAKAKIRKGNCLFSEVALTSGFTDEYTFSKAFKRICKCNPIDYKKYFWK